MSNSSINIQVNSREILMSYRATSFDCGKTTVIRSDLKDKTTEKELPPNRILKVEDRVQVRLYELETDLKTRHN